MPDYQSAYRKFYSCETVLVKIIIQYIVGYRTSENIITCLYWSVSRIWHGGPQNTGTSITKSIWNYRNSASIV